MTKEELKEHCKKQVEMCEMWAHSKGKEPGGKIYEEHKLILELLEKEPKIGQWVKQYYKVCNCLDSNCSMHCVVADNGKYTKGNEDKCEWTITCYKEVCSNCGIQNSSCYKNFCPNCGCRMVEPQKSEKV